MRHSVSSTIENEDVKSILKKITKQNRNEVQLETKAALAALAES